MLLRAAYIYDQLYAFAARSSSMMRVDRPPEKASVGWGVLCCIHTITQLYVHMYHIHASAVSMRSSCDARAPSVRFASAIVIVVIVCLYIANKYLLNEMERTIVRQRIGLECLILNIYEAEWLGRVHDCLLAASGAVSSEHRYRYYLTIVLQCVYEHLVPLPPVLI